VTVPLGPGWVTLHVSVLWTSVRLALVSINVSVLTDLALPRLRGCVRRGNYLEIVPALRDKVHRPARRRRCAGVPEGL
jgi:hypothetical protein